MLSPFSWLFDTSGFVPRWDCGDWSPALGWLHIAADLLIWLAYLAIPVVLVGFVRRRRDVPFPRLFWLFGLFIVTCGTTHLLEAVIFYDPQYRLAAVVKVLTAAASWATVIALIPAVPKALALRTPADLEREVAARTAELRASEGRFHDLADAMPQIVWTADPTGRIDYYNRRWYERTGAAPGEGDESWLPVLHPDDRDRCTREWYDAVRKGVGFELQLRFMFPASGEYRWHLGRALPARDAGGKVTRWYGTCTDIHDQKTAADALEAARADAHRALGRMRAVVNTIADGVIVTDQAGNLVDWNAAALRTFGFAPGDEVGRNLAAIAGAFTMSPPGGPPLAFDRWPLTRVLAGEAVADEELVVRRLETGRERVITFSGAGVAGPDGGVELAVLTLHDVTARRRAEAEVRRTGGLLGAVADGTTDAVFVKDRDGKYLLFNPAAARFVGRPADEVLGKDDTELFDPAEAAVIMSRDRGVMESGRVETEEETLTAAGVTRVYQATKGPYRDGAGAVVGVIGISRDITDRRRAEDALRASEERFRAFMDHNPATAFIKDEGGHYLYANPSWRRQFDPEPAAWQGKSDFDLWPADTAALFRASDLDCLARGEAIQVEEAEGPGGRGRTWLVMKFPLADGGRRLIGGNAWDITPRVRAEAALRESRVRLAEAVRIARMGYWSRDLATGAVQWSAELYDIFGLEPGGFAETYEAFLAAVHPDDRAAVRERIERAVAAGGAFEHGYRILVGGDVRAIYEVGHVLPGAGGAAGRIAGTAQDVTDRYQAEQGLRLRDRAIRAASQGIVITDSKHPDDPIVYASPAYEKMTGYDAGEILGRNSRFLQGAGTDRAAVAAVREAVAAGAECRVELLNYRKDGTTFWNELAVSPVRDDGGHLTHFVGVQTDVTERRRLAAERDELLARLQLQIERMPLAYLLSGPDLRYVGWNPAAERIFGFAEADVLGKHPFDLIVPPASRPLVQGVFDRLTAGDMGAHGECENVTKDGRTITCRWHNTPLMDADGRFTGLLSMAEDISDRRLLEEQFRQAQKMEAVGQLAGGVAHDFNNLLTVINGYSEMVLDAMPSGNPLRKSVAAVREAGDRAVGLTAQLLMFSRKAVLEPRVIDPNAVVVETGNMLRRLIGDDIRLTTVPGPGVSRVKVDPGQFGQVLMNLAVNARDAMPTGGTITIETRDVELDAEYARTHAAVTPGRYVLTAVSDTGTGMTTKVVARAFEPFFTTKEAGHGTGLGLATVYGIVKQSGGHVAVYSEVGIGTTFKVYLPAVEGAAEAGPAERPWVRGGTESVLVVEDQHDVRELARSALETYGYAVRAASDGAEALRRVAADGAAVDILVTDVVMPGMSGREVAEALRARFPKVKVLYLSGYTDDAVVRHGILQAQVAFLQKPYTPLSLARKVREVLDGGG